jgi:hypothetical protein
LIQVNLIHQSISSTHPTTKVNTPPKKKTAANGENAEEGGGAFRWTLENERKVHLHLSFHTFDLRLTHPQLLVLIQGRYLTAEDYERLLTVFPGSRPPLPQSTLSISLLTCSFIGTNLNGVKIKCSRFRVEQRNLYEQLGWQLFDGGAVKKKKKKKKETTTKTPTKRGAEDGEEQKTATKKPRTPRAKKGKKVDEPKSDEGEPEGEIDADIGAAVKEEVTEDMV